MTLREYLVKLGFKVDDTSWAKFNQRLETSASNAAYLGKTMTLAAIEIGIAVERLTANYERLYYVSQRTGSSVASLKAYEFSARQIGLTAEQAQSSVESFATAMRLNPGVRSLFAGLGVDTKDAVKGIGQMIDIFKGKFGVKF